MKATAGIAERLGIADPWVEQARVFWLAVDPSQVRALAAIMNDRRARFVTITAIELPEQQGIRLDYLWDLDGQLLGFSIHLAGNSIESIFDLCEAVDWIEREVHEGFAVDFTGRAYEPLLLRPGDELGVNLREGPR